MGKLPMHHRAPNGSKQSHNVSLFYVSRDLDGDEIGLDVNQFQLKYNPQNYLSNPLTGPFATLVPRKETFIENENVTDCFFLQLRHIIT